MCVSVHTLECNLPPPRKTPPTQPDPHPPAQTPHPPGQTPHHHHMTIWRVTIRSPLPGLIVFGAFRVEDVKSGLPEMTYFFWNRFFLVLCL